MRQQNNINNKRELHPAGIFAILFLFAFFFSITIIDNSYEASKNYGIIEEGNKLNPQGEQLVPTVGADTGKEENIGVDQHSDNSHYLVAIDPGHGGNDPGKVSDDGKFEKDVNLEISFVLQKELEARGMSTILLRDTDKNLATEGATNKKVSDMKNRVAIINDNNADILISIHQNSYTDPSVRGPQVFYHSGSGESEAFALLLQEKLNAIYPEHSRDAKQGNDYYILNKTVCPGVIVECGFLSCPEETALLTSQEYQQKIASAIADAIEETY